MTRNEDLRILREYLLDAKHYLAIGQIAEATGIPKAVVTQALQDVKLWHREGYTVARFGTRYRLTVRKHTKGDTA